MAHGTLPVVAAPEGFSQKLAHAAAIGQPGKDVDIGEVRQALLRLADLGDVRADAAEALEATRSIDNRVARDGNPALSARGLELHLQRIEWLLLEKDPAEVGVASEQRRQ